jgi:predicted metal-dependent phosphoesterase TrpH
MSRAGELAAPFISAGLLLVSLVAGHGCGRRHAPPARADAGAPALLSSAEEEAPNEEEPWAPETGPRGNLSFEVVDAATRKPTPCRLTFIGLGKTPTPRFTNREIPLRIDGGIASYNRVFSLTGRGGLTLRHGSYDVIVSHGLEWSMVTEHRVRVGTTPVKVSAALSHVVPTPGWVSADLHVHAAPSWDSVVPLSARVEEFGAEGVDVLVATDHNTVSDYAPVIAEIGAKKLLGSVRGVEVSTMDWGHFGAFPVNPEPEWRVLHGMRMEGMSPIELLHAVRQHDPDALVTVNHPRMGILGYFSRAGFDRVTARFAKPRASFDFDAVEVMNGYQGASREQIDAVLGDWYSLLLHGHRSTAVGNSDTHHMHYAIAGYPRNYVEVRDDRADATDGDELAQALKAGHSFFTTGPILELDVDGKHMGELVRAPSGKVTLHLRVRAAPWVSVSNVDILVDGAVVHSEPVGPSTAPLRLDLTVPLSVGRDAFVLVVAEGDRLPKPLIGPGRRPIPCIAVSNPVRLDVDGNGRYDAPKH